MKNNSNKGNNSKRNNKINSNSKQDVMSGCSNMLMILLVVLVILYVAKEYQKQQNQKTQVNGEGFQGMDSEGAMANQIENFIAYPDEQKFCPNIYNSASSFWTTLPKEYSKGFMAKFCCTSCFYHVSKEIICGKNKTGKYKICTLKEKDIDNLILYVSNQNNNSENHSSMTFKKAKKLKDKLDSLIGSKVLKMKKNNIYYAIQVLKNKEQLKDHEKNPTIADQLYEESKKKTYKCGKK